jgi:hypothetical protein
LRKSARAKWLVEYEGLKAIHKSVTVNYVIKNLSLELVLIALKNAFKKIAKIKFYSLWDDREQI